MRVALNTNLLAYAEGTNGAERKEAALRLIQRLPVASIVLPAPFSATPHALLRTLVGDVARDEV